MIEKPSLPGGRPCETSPKVCVEFTGATLARGSVFSVVRGHFPVSSDTPS